MVGSSYFVRFKSIFCHYELTVPSWPRGRLLATILSKTNCCTPLILCTQYLRPYLSSFCRDQLFTRSVFGQKTPFALVYMRSYKQYICVAICVAISRGGAGERACADGRFSHASGPGAWVVLLRVFPMAMCRDQGGGGSAGARRVRSVGKV